MGRRSVRRGVRSLSGAWEGGCRGLCQIKDTPTLNPTCYHGP